MNKSESIKELAAALAKAQGEIKGAVRETKNPFFNSMYADLSSVMDACREPLSKNGLAVLQIPLESQDLSKVSLETILAHSSGEWISGIITMRPGYTSKSGEFIPEQDPQAIGSCLTYARRYGLMAIVGITSKEDDDDGAAASPRKDPPPKSTKADYVEKILEFLKNNDITEKFVLDMCITKGLCSPGATELDELTGELLKKISSNEGLKRILDLWTSQKEPGEVPPDPVPKEEPPKETMDEVSWKEMVVLAGPFKGKKLGSLSEEDIFSIYRSFKPATDIDSVRMKKALLQWMQEVQSKEGK